MSPEQIRSELLTKTIGERATLDEAVAFRFKSVDPVG